MSRLALWAVGPEGTSYSTSICTNTPTNTPTLTGTIIPTNTFTATATATPCAVVILLDEHFDTGLGLFTSSVGICNPGGCGWTDTGTPHGGTHAAFAPDLPDITDQYLTTNNSYTIPAGTVSAEFSFWNNYDLENTYDGGVLETSTDNGASWQDILDTSGNAFLTGAYNGTISSSFQSPISGRDAWTGDGGGYLQTRVNLAGMIGRTFKIRFREANDNSVSINGWTVDDALLSYTTSGGCGTPPTSTNTVIVTATNTVISTATNTFTRTPTQVPSSTITATGVPSDTPTTGPGTPSSTPTTEPGSPTATSEPGSPTATLTPCTISFSDVNPSDYFYEDVRCVYCLGAVSGYSDGTFRPFNNATRGQMTKIIVIALQIPISTPTGTPTFSDVPAGSTFYDWIETAAANDIVSGYADGTFRPNNDVTRGQLSKIVVTAGSQVFGWTLVNPSIATFSDVAPGSAFYEYIETASCHSVISGYADGTFRPDNNAIRAQISKMVCRTSQNPANTCGDQLSTNR